MQIIIYNLPTQALSLPDVQLYLCMDRKDLENKLLIMRPDMLIVPESEGEEVLQLISSLQIEYMLAVTVVSENEGLHHERKWTRLGAHQVWPLKEWENRLKTSDIFISQADLPNDLQKQNYAEANALTPQREWESEETIVITVGGVYSGAGSTHMALLIANYLSRIQKQPVAVWEATEKPTFRIMDYVQSGNISFKPRFKIGKVTLLTSDVDRQALEAAADKFRYVVMDMGRIQSCPQKDTFFRSELAVLVGSGSVWRVKENLEFCRTHSQFRQSHLRVVLPFASQETKDEVALLLSGRPVFSMPIHSDVFEQQDDSDQILEGILSPLIPKKNKKRFSKLFQG